MPVGFARDSDGYYYITYEQSSAPPDPDKTGPNGSHLWLKMYDRDIPKKFKLQQCYPNPFSQSTIIHYELHNPEQVSLRILDAMGREIRILTDDYQPAGNYSTAWDG